MTDTQKPKTTRLILRDAEIRELADKADEGQEPTEYLLAIARAVEKAVLQKVGIK